MKFVAFLLYLNNTGYSWICRTYQITENKTNVYEDETSGSIRIRTIIHIKVVRNKKSDSVLYKHKTFDHKD